MKITLLLAAIFYVALMAALGQTISPTAEEFKGPRAKGEFVLQNPGDRPASVTVEVKGFTVTNGKPVLIPLDAGTTVLIKKPSFTIGPHNTYEVDFDGRCAALPCRFMLLSHWSPTRNAEGLNIAVHLGGVVYVCERQKHCRLDQLRDLGFDPNKM